MKNESVNYLFCSLQLGIRGFWASEEYYFHSSEQLLLVARVCPRVETMLFMFKNEEARFQDLTAFSCLQVNIC